MAEEDTSTMNLDLNLGPVDNPRSDATEVAPGFDNDDAINLEDWLHDPRRVRDVVRQRWRSLRRQLPIPQQTPNLALEFIGGNAPPSGQVSIASEETPVGEVMKSCENGSGCEDQEALKKESGKDESDGSFFDCNICLDLAREPVVTCCGHLFCWPCLYRWLHHHSEAKECPVCKGEVSSKNITPIYGRGNTVSDPSTDSTLKVPLRPQARRVESWRQTFQRAAFAIPMEEMLRRLGSTFDLSWELAQTEAQAQPRSSEAPSEALLGRILSSRGLRRERTTTSMVPTIDLIDSSSPNVEARDMDGRRFSSLRLRRSNSSRAAALSNYSLIPAIAPGPETESPGAVTLVDAYYDNGANTALISPQGEWVEDRDSLSSIAAVIQSVDTAVETDSTVSLSTSSSRRRHDASRISDVDSGDSTRPPPPRRRRLN